jgi:hypothetical protein
MAEEAPICHSLLFEDFGYTANTPASRAVLDGTYVVLQDSDTATWKLFEEIMTICQRVPKDLVSISITPLSGSNTGKLSIRKHLHLSLANTLDTT